MHKNVLQADNTVLLIVDIQEKFASGILGFENLVLSAEKLVLGFKTLGIPVIYTEQYPKGLGKTVSQLGQHLENIKGFEKTEFSCCLNPEFMMYLDNLNRKQVVICGIETHVCVSQTVHDLIDRKYQPHVIADAVSSRSIDNYNAGIDKMKQAGAVISSFEIALFELLQDAKHPQFKQIQNIIK